ncbi:MAG: HAMP domain-containing sensor histidine kinase, partial [Anaerolineaceae bacterium]
MANFTHMPNYDIRNDGAGPYAVFYCESCSREFRSQPDIAGSIKQDLGRSAVSGLLRKVPLVGNAVADNVVGEDPRYSYKMTPQQIDAAWQQAQVHFRQCPTCQRIVCLSDFDTQSGFCQDDSPRTGEIAEARGAQAGAAIKGFAETLLSDPEEDMFTREDRQEFLGIIAKSCKRQLGMISDLLNIAKIDAGKALELHLSPLRLGEIAEDVVRLDQENTSLHTYKVDMDEEIPPVIADEVKVDRIITNLVSNARKYSPEGGEIGISVKFNADEQRVYVSVMDQG